MREFADKLFKDAGMRVAILHPHDPTSLLTPTPSHTFPKPCTHHSHHLQH
ncbi:hypothetical protein AZE42_10587 [Rhizopogon vesiculosus]|uniref:Uncharacterized protein n=1 Tax=Rhizopogon vesiculosus TaxID=180088 RepID=A0A1J8QPZ0_9AGAM|nr:hypothetical protein AZE42_10587 [Rhizopogon vesiculosus]